MNRNLFLAFTLSILVYVSWFLWIEKTQPKHPPKPASAQAQTKTFKSEPQTPAAQTQEEARAKDSGPAGEFRTPQADITFSRAGAAITGFRFYGPVSPAELVMHDKPGFFSCMTAAEFALKSKSADSITFEAEVNGISVEKKYTWNPENDINRLEIKAANKTKKPLELPPWRLALGPGIGTVKSELGENASNWKAAFVVQEENKKNPSLKNLAKETPQSPWLWAGVQNRYFLAAVIGAADMYGPLEFSEHKFGKEKAPSVFFPVAKTELAPGTEKIWAFDYYIGPKDYRKLTALGHGLNRSVEFGFFAQLGKLALKILYFNRSFTGNYGWAIILMTVLVQILMAPLTFKSSKAMLVMRKIQPEMQKLQERYKSDPQRLNREMLELYKKHGANPLTGCLPMLIQIPIFFALFTALRNSWDLHGAVFILWIRDLSAKDPYYVLPIVMGAIMFFQQKMTLSSGGDAAQNAVMKWMPVIFTFMFLNFPSGLVLYWLTSSIIGFCQQLYMQKQMA